MLFKQFEKNFEEIIARPLTSKQRDVFPILLGMCMEGSGLYAIVLKDKKTLTAAWKRISKWIGDELEGDE